MLIAINGSLPEYIPIVIVLKSYEPISQKPWVLCHIVQGQCQYLSKPHHQIIFLRVIELNLQAYFQ